MRNNVLFMHHWEKKNYSYGRVTSYIVVAAVIGLIGFFIGLRAASIPSLYALTGSGAVIGVGQTPPTEIISDKSDIEFKEFWQLWQMMKDKYYEQPVKDKSLFYGAMQGLAGSVGDPYTAFFEPQLADDFQQSLNGTFEGIGAQIGTKNSQLVIIAPLPETPAEKAGLLAGDFILKINNQETEGMSEEKAVTLIRGPRGTKVTLSIFRPSQKKPPFDLEIIRKQILVKSVTWKMLPHQIAYINVTHFNSDTKEGFRQTVTAVLKQNPKGVILDLRNDPGGFLDTALSMAGEWLGDDVVAKERRQGKIIDELHGDGARRFKGMPTIVLVNQGSASASEIVAGALQDSGQAKLLGMKTFGKGSVQDFQNFADGSAVKITIAEWLTPKERAINKVGLDPDILVDRTPEDYEAERDPQLDRALGILSGTESASSTPAIIPTSTRK